MMRLFIFIAIIFFFSESANTANANQIATQSPIFFKADKLENRQDPEKLIASGNVEMVYEGQILRADSVVYDRVQDKIFASGNVSLLLPDGEVLFSDSGEITGNLREGILENIRLLFTDNSRAAATRGRLTAGQITNLERASYSPCQICPESENRPTWQLNADRITHDKLSRVIEYKDVFLEFYGVPIATPPIFFIQTLL
ncbi:MAG: hypothetical protein VW445_12250 [Rhodospirillaceae bacterium]